MKPIKLIISAFGPYAEEMPPIVFSEFEKEGLFLIAGDTGSGKTTIFDAITFALFGQTSGSYKDSKYLRCDLAEDNVKTYVDFYFSHRGDDYHIKRSPSYTRRKFRGTGVTNENESVILYKNDENPVEGIQVVNERIKELLNINLEQFKQVAMIAQGEFFKLLNATTDERTKILRNIFMTKSYQDISFGLKTMKGDMYGKKEYLKATIDQHFNGVRIDEGMDIYGEYLDLVEELRASRDLLGVEKFVEFIDRLVEIIDKERWVSGEKAKVTEEKLKKIRSEIAEANAVNELFADVEKYKGQVTKLEAGAGENKGDKARLELCEEATNVVNPLYLAFREAKSEADKLNHGIISDEKAMALVGAELENAAKSLNSARENEKNLDGYKAHINKIDAAEENYKKRDEIRKNQAAHIEKQKDTKVKLDAALEDKNNREEELKAAESEKETNKDVAADYLQCERKLGEFGRLIGEAEEIGRECVQVQKLKVELATKKEELEGKLHSFENASKDRVEYEVKFNAGRAGILAKMLKNGEKCPVCGALEHPEPAKICDESLGEEELEKLKDAEEKAREEMEKVANEHTGIESSLATMETTMNKRLEALGNEEILKGAVEPGKEGARGAKDGGTVQITEGAQSNGGAQSDGGAQSNGGAQSDGATESVGICQITRLQAITNYLKQEYESLQKRCEELKAKKEKFALVEEKIENLRKTVLPGLEKKIEEARKEAELAEQMVERDKTTLETIGEMEFDSWNEALLSREKYGKMIREIGEAISKAQEVFDASNKKKTELASSISTKKEALEAKMEDCKAKEEAFAKARSKRFDNDEAFVGCVVGPEIIEKLREKISKYESDVKIARSHLEEASKKTEGKMPVDLTEIKEKEEARSKEYTELVEKSNRAKEKMDTNLEIKAKMEESAGEYCEINRKYMIYERLYNLVSGNISHASRVTLEQYIQATGFDGILAAANRRLGPMSDDRFELMRKEEHSNRGKEFLDLVVLDRYTGKKRPVGNLSGGESFKASLSLALGLSDTISQNNGGVQMDALFVDEGFGTLDKRSIDGALDILMGLSGTGKMVGVISHREELKESIENKIIVEKVDRGGSTFYTEGV